MIRPLLCLPLVALSSTSALAQEASLEKRATKLHALAGGEWCDGPEAEWAPEDSYSEWTFSFQPSWSEDAEEETVTLVRLFCMAGAYNITHAYYIERDLQGLMPLGFAVPTYDIAYENDDSLEGAVLGIEMTGMGAVTTLVNSEFDPETRTIHSHSLWRGVGDASSTAVYEFREGGFALVRYDIDASYDGEVNPETVFDHE